MTIITYMRQSPCDTSSAVTYLSIANKCLQERSEQKANLHTESRFAAKPHSDGGLPHSGSGLKIQPVAHATELGVKLLQGREWGNIRFSESVKLVSTV